jgi:hypothetical protein
MELLLLIIYGLFAISYTLLFLSFLDKDSIGGFGMFIIFVFEGLAIGALWPLSGTLTFYWKMRGKK